MAASRWYSFVRIIMVICSVLGIIISLYSYYVEVAKENDPTFRAFCDISESISCSKAFTSRYGKGFGILGLIFGSDHWMNQPNSVYGSAFYSMQIFLSVTHTLGAAVLQVCFSSLSLLMSVYLACVLYFILQDFCIVCVTTYVINIFLFLCTVAKARYLYRLELNVIRQKSS